MVQRKHWMNSYCPRCKGSIEETVQHLFQCPHPCSQKCFESSKTTFRNWLIERKTCPELRENIMYIVHCWRQNRNADITSVRTKPAREQIRLGISHMMEGRIVCSFCETQQKYYELLNLSSIDKVIYL